MNPFHVFQEDAHAMQALAVSLFEQAPDGILATDRGGRIVLVNTRIEEMFGYPREKLLGREVEVLLPERFHNKHVEDRRSYADKPYLRQMGEGRQLFARHRNGKEFAVHISLSPVRTPKEELFVCFIRDVSRIHQIEKRLSQVQRMEAIGHLAGGIAHDFNNLLTIINGHAEGLFSGLRADLRACQRVQEIAKAGEKAARLTRQLLAFSRQQILRPRVINLNDLVIDFQRMLGRLIGEHIALTIRLSPDLKHVKVDPTQIEQVLMNLAVNARDAMPKGGRLTIETSSVVLGDSFVESHPEAKPGPYVCLSMSDTGCGMDAETVARIFEPFFTTKEPGKGTGLGLAMVYGIVKQSGGYIYVESTLGYGSRFKIYLPVTSDAPSGSLAKPTVAAPTGKETVLLVEDEDGVRSLLRSTLEEHGYTVLDAANGQEALKLLRTTTQAIDLLLTDVVMPEMGGRALAEQFVAMYPEAKLIFMSGYTDDIVVRHGVHEAEVEFLQKPYTMNAMLSKVREVLDRGQVSKGVSPAAAPVGAAV